MYNLPAFQGDPASGLEIMREYPFATLISGEISDLQISHLPLLLHEEDGHPVLWGHLALRNPQIAGLRRDPRVTALFHGPHAYVTPRWYVSGRDVPTWNYVVTHVTGRVRFVDEPGAMVETLRALSERFEREERSPWMFELPEDLRDAGLLARAIAAFVVVPEKIETKLKLGQSRPRGDREAVLAGLEARTDAMSHDLARWTKKSLS